MYNFNEGVVIIFLEFYKTARGDNPVMDYILKLDNVVDAHDILETLDRIDMEGASYLITGGETTRSLGDGLWEIKMSKHRLYYIYCCEKRVFILHACFKQKQKAESKDIEIGKKRMKEIMIREKE